MFYADTLGLPPSWSRSAASRSARQALLDAGAPARHAGGRGRTLAAWQAARAPAAANDTGECDAPAELSGGAWRSGEGRGEPASRCEHRCVDRRSRERGPRFRGRARPRARGRRAGAARADVPRARRASCARSASACSTSSRSSTSSRTATGATKGDSWIDIDGGIGTMLVFASKGSRELPNSRVYLDGALEGLSKGGTFVGQHICVPLEGAAVHINAFNFPVWGMLEKLAPALLAGVPAIVKPATATSYLTELVVRRIIETGILPPGALQLICGGVGDLFDHLGCQDVVSFTGSAATAAKLRTHPAVVRAQRALRRGDGFAQFLDPRARTPGPGRRSSTLFVQEVAREMTVKAGQKCTAIRKALVPRAMLGEVVAALAGEAGRDRRRRPARRGRRHGAAREPRAARRSARARRRTASASPSGSRGDPDAIRDRRAATASRALSCAPILLAVPRRREGARRAFGRGLRSRSATVIGYDGDARRDRARAPRRGQPRRARCSPPTTRLPPNSCSGSRRTTGACWS